MKSLISSYAMAATGFVIPFGGLQWFGATVSGLLAADRRVFGHVCSMLFLSPKWSTKKQPAAGAGRLRLTAAPGLPAVMVNPFFYDDPVKTESAEKQPQRLKTANVTANDGARHRLVAGRGQGGRIHAKAATANSTSPKTGPKSTRLSACPKTVGARLSFVPAYRGFRLSLLILGHS